MNKIFFTILFFISANLSAQINQGLIAYYPFNNGSLSDASGHGFNAVNHGAKPTQDRFGFSSSAFDFDGVDDYVSIPPFTGYTEVGDFSIALWVKLHNGPTNKSSYFVDIRGDGYLYPSGSYMKVFGSTNIRHGIDYGHIPYKHTEYNVNVNSITDVWTHLVLVRQGVTLRTYLNAIQLQDNFLGVEPLGELIDLSHGGRIGTTVAPVRIPDYYANTSVDELRIYNRALSQAEIEELFGETSPYFCGHNNEKVLVCHNGHEICISINALPAHLAHGDYLGYCQGQTNPLSILNENEQPDKFMLYQNYPNPFNPETKIEFEIKDNVPVKLIIYDMTGKGVDVLIDNELKAGTYQLRWNASDYPSGTYIYTFTAGDYKDTKKMVLIK